MFFFISYFIFVCSVSALAFLDFRKSLSDVQTVTLTGNILEIETVGSFEVLPEYEYILDQWKTGDGIDHINIYSKGKTLIGRQLSNFAEIPFDHPKHGKFMSVEGYWYWLSCKDDILRKLSGFKAKEYGREIGANDWCDNLEFKENIKLAIKSKLEQNPQTFKDFYDSTLQSLRCGRI